MDGHSLKGLPCSNRRFAAHREGVGYRKLKTKINRLRFCDFRFLPVVWPAYPSSKTEDAIPSRTPREKTSRA
jgi:hypothetical protein